MKMSRVRTFGSSVAGKKQVWVGLVLLLLVIAVWTITAARRAAPESLQQRTFDVASQLQCPVCHGESVADAPSPLAQEMRSLISEQLSQGMSEQQVINYFHQRYGDQILEAPPVSGFTLVIWVGPGLALLLGLWILISVVREFRQQQPAFSIESQLDPVPADQVAAITSAAPRLSSEDRERYRALLLAEMDELEGYSHAGGTTNRETAPQVERGELA